MRYTIIIAAYGAVVSSIALLWNILRDAKDKPKIILDVEIGIIVPVQNKKKYIFVTITNVGRRPVIVKELKGVKTKLINLPYVLIATKQLPKILNEGEYIQETIHDLNWLDNIEKIYIKDSTGREWYLPRNKMKLLKKQYTEYKKQIW